MWGLNKLVWHIIRAQKIRAILFIKECYLNADIHTHKKKLFNNPTDKIIFDNKIKRTKTIIQTIKTLMYALGIKMQAILWSKK